MIGVANLKHTNIMKEANTASSIPFGSVKRNSSFIDLTGMVFNELTVIKESIPRIGSRGRKFTMWTCKCSCGTERDIQGECLKKGNNKSCGCLRRKMTIQKNTTHGECHTPEYSAWGQMVDRCSNPKSTCWKNYGGRGISVCERWLKFENFLEDMGKKTSPLHSIDRKNVNGNYESENCKWSTNKEQQRNKRNSRLIEINGESKCVAEWSDISGIRQGTIWHRLKSGWTNKSSVFHALNYGHRPVDT